MTEGNFGAIASQFAELERQAPDLITLEALRSRLTKVEPARPRGFVGGIDSSDNLLLSIPEHPGAAVAGYSFALVVVDPDGKLMMELKRLAEEESPEYLEELEIALVYGIPGRVAQRPLRMAEYQLRSILPLPRTQSPYNPAEVLPELKVRLVAARQREMTERKAIATALYQRDLVQGVQKMSLLLKDGRLSSQNVRPAYMDDIGRSAVGRGVRLVGVVKQGTTLWSILYPYHKAVWAVEKAPYMTLVPPGLIIEAYQLDQVETKTLRLGAQENRSLGGIGGAWVLYGHGPRLFYVLEFNVYDLERYRPLVKTSAPLELHNRLTRQWQLGTFVVEQVGPDAYQGTQLDVTPRDIEELIAPTINEIHYLATIGHLSPGYPLVLADAHDACKISQDRKERINQRLITALESEGFRAIDFELWSEDPHKIFER